MPTSRCGLRTAGSFLLLQAMLLVAASASAEPVSLDQMPPPPPTPELSAELMRAPIPTPALPMEPGTTNRVQSSARRMMALPAEASGVQSHVFDATSERGTTGMPASRGAAARAQGNAGKSTPLPTGPQGEGGDLDPDLKEAAKSARQWVEESVPWAKQKTTASDDASESRRRADATEPEQAPPGSVYTNGGSENRSVRPSSRSGEFNFVGELIKFLKDVLGQPIAWLVIALIVAGSAGVSMAKRRAK
jgi:hypothetical protein